MMRTPQMIRMARPARLLAGGRRESGRGRTAVAVFIAALACLGAGCAKGPARTTAPLSAEQASARLAELLDSPLPQDASEVSALRMQGQANVLAVRFTCSTQGLGEFLRRSPHLPKKLTGERSILGHTGSDPDWWRPELLRNAGSGSASWQKDSQKLACDVLAGRSPPKWLWTVYLRIVVQPAGATTGQAPARG